MIVLRLALAEARRQVGRLSLAAATVGGAIALVVWSMGTVATTKAQHRHRIRAMVGECDAWVVPDRPDPFSAANRGRFGMQTAPTEKPRVWGIPEETVRALRADPRVRRLDAYPVTNVQIDYRPEGQLISGPRPRGGLSGTNAPECPYGRERLEGKWIRSGLSAGPVPVVISVAAFYRAPPPIGETISLLSTRGSVEARVIGHIRQPPAGRGMARPPLPTLFVSAEDYEHYFREETPRPPYDVLTLHLAPGADVSALRAAWDARLREGQFPCRIEDPEGLLETMNAGSSAELLRTAPLVVGLAIVATICIIATTLLLGLHRRLHTLAMLRAIGAERHQVYLLILIEGVLVAAVGTLAGILVGGAALSIMTFRLPEVFPAGAALDRPTILAALACAVLGMAGAAAWPCVQAARMRPLDVLQNLYGERRRISPRRTMTGLLLLLPAPVLTLNLPMPAALRCRLLLFGALPALVVGCVLIAPLLVTAAERSFGAPLCRLVGLHPRLLSRPLSRQIGRTAGTAITLTIGLGLYIAIETWGHSMTQPFLPNPGLPDVIVSFLPGGVPPAHLEKVLATPGFRGNQAFALEAEQFVLDDATLDRMRRNGRSDVKQNNVLLLGIDAVKSFVGPHRMFDLTLSGGRPEEVARRLEAGGACVVPTMFAQQSGFRVGDKIGLRVPTRQTKGAGEVIGERMEQLEIVGVLDVNWHLITARAGLRGQDGHPFATLSPVFVSCAQARSISSRSSDIRFLWANLDDDLRALPVEDATTEVQNRLVHALHGAAGGPLPVGSAGAVVPGTQGGFPQRSGTFGPGGPRGRGGRGRPPGENGNGLGTFVQASHRDFVFAGTTRHADDLIGRMSRVPLWALGILSLTIVNAVVASVQSRRMEIGRMRAIGLSRSQLLRLICIEGLLIGLAVALLSLLFGIESGWCFTGYSRAVMPFGGLPVSFQLPWGRLALGNLLALALALAAAIVPACLIARREPVAFIQSAGDI